MLPLLFFITALVYSTAGLAGGTTYLALLTLFAFPHDLIPMLALLCNLVVSLGGVWHFSRQLPLRRILPFLLTSIPMSYWGASIPIGRRPFTILLAISLLAAAFRLLIADESLKPGRQIDRKIAWFVGLPSGGLLGFLSGLVGIGGGVFLSPLLLLTGWTDPRGAAASASLFIFVNSLAGLAGQFSKEGLPLPGPEAIGLLLAVFLGGQIGSRLGSRQFSRLTLQRITALLIAVVSAKLWWGLF